MSSIIALVVFTVDTPLGRVGLSEALLFVGKTKGQTRDGRGLGYVFRGEPTGCYSLKITFLLQWLLLVLLLKPLTTLFHHFHSEPVYLFLKLFREDKVRNEHVSPHLWDDHSNDKNEEENDNAAWRDFLEVDHETADQGKGK